MREIKFRAWDLQKVRMVPVSVIEFDGAGDICNIDFLDEIVNTPRGAQTRFQHRENSEDLMLMQYTGLKDKNGMEIYEGDIVYATAPTILPEWVEDDGNYEIVWREDEACFGVLESRDERGEPECWKCPVEWWKTFEIVGNIYEHPHLLPHEKE
jgi:uncharacterized phage protein (TIGR01671 family)